MKRYNPKEIEPKWQGIWDQTNTYTVDLQSNKPKYIAMSMFNYPSGNGIHIGHAMNYTISDVKARFKRQQGFESYHPVGWDAFGLPAENYAIKTGVSPQESMANIIPGYHKQYKAMGWSNDWEKEISTHTPEYYKWTQWIFIQMHKHGLAYQDSRMQWWCPIDKTVLANEQVIDGKCWRHDGPDDPLAEKREVKQWFFKITNYADELLEAIDGLDWSDSVKLAQKNWIGKSEGAEIDFTVEQPELQRPSAAMQWITVFTTRPDTLFGATFIAVAPEHPWANDLAAKSKDKEVDDYIYNAINRSEMERLEGKEKTGVFTGSYAINPLTKEKIPIWIADYVLGGYGTGAIMGVPAHDERDNQFARKHSLKIVPVIEPSDIRATLIPQFVFEVGASEEARMEEFKAQQAKGRLVFVGEGKMVNSGSYNGMRSEEARKKIIVDITEMNVGAAHKQAREKIQYKMRDWSVSRQRYWGAPIPIIHCEKCGPVLVPEADLPVILPELNSFEPTGDGRSALARAKDWLETDCPQCGGRAERETDTMDTYVDSSWYMYRYMDPHNQSMIFDEQLVKKCVPIDFYNGADHATAHLLYARFFGHFFKKLGLVDEPEPFTQFLFNGKVTAANGEMFSKSKGNGVDPLEIIEQGYGADALRTYLMFAAPLELWVRWDPQGVPGAHRFLSRVWTLVQEYLEKDEMMITEDDHDFQILHSTNMMIKKVTEDLEENRYNTAIAAMMACTNDLYKFKETAFGKNKVWDEALYSLVACVAPFAPHIADELWEQLGHSSTVHKDSWPLVDQKYLQSKTITIAVQVNGKLRATLEVDPDASEPFIISSAKEDEKIAALIDGKEIKKEIYVPGRLVSLVV